MQLLKHFKELSIYPKNAKELKGLILQLAVQGKLTADWRLRHSELVSGTYSAKALLASIKAEKEQLIKDKKIKKEKPLSAVTENEMAFDIPEGWEWCRLNDLGVIGSSSRVHKKDWQTEGIPFYRAREIVKLSKFGSVINDLFITEELFNKHKENGIIPEKNDIMLTGVGTIGIPYIVKEDDKFYFKDASVLIFKNISNLTPDYLNLFFSCKYWKDEIHKESMGTTVHTLTISRAKFVPTVFPPLAEQKAIVETVNTLFKEVEALEKLTVERISLKEDFITSALRELSTGDTAKEWLFLQKHFSTFMNEESNIKKLRETILQLAVQGKLTANWRADHSELISGSHSAKTLLKSIKAEKEQLIKDKKIKKEKPLPAIEANDIPYELPDGWEWCRLGETLLYSDAGKSPNCEKRPVIKNEWGVLTTTAIQQNKFLESANKVLPFNYEVNPTQIVEIGDILITRAGPINRTGIACKVNDLNFNLILSDKTIRLKYIENSLYPDFIVLTLNSSPVRKLLLGKMIGMASSQVNISQANIKGICFPFPSLAEQKVIIEKVNSLMALCDELEKQVVASKSTAEMLMQSVLREVFQGKAKPKPVIEEEILTASKA